MFSYPHQIPWGVFLLSMVMWMQLAVLSGYPLHAVRTSMQAAVHCLLAKTPYDVARTLVWILFIMRRLLQSLANTVQDLTGWLQWSVNWHRGWYASWHLSVPSGVLFDFWATGHLTYLLYCLSLVFSPSSCGWTGVSMGGGGFT